MEKEKHYIGWGQLLLLLFMCRVFTLMTFVPFARDGEGLTLRLTAAAVSTAVQAVLLIPVAVLKKSSTEVILQKNKPCGIIAAALYLLFFLFVTANSLVHFQSFLSARFFPYADSLVWIGVMLIVCVYCACLGTEALGRSAVLLFWIFVISLAAMAISSAKEAESANLYFEPLNTGELFSAVLDDLSRSGEICAAVFLAGRVRPAEQNRPDGKSGCGLRCGIYGLLASKLVLAETVMLLVAAVLGDFALLSDYPFLALGTFGGERFIQRADSLYLIVWTITAVLNVSLFLHISAGLFGEVFAKMKFRTALSALLVFWTLPLATAAGKIFSQLYSEVCSGWAVIIMAGIIPVAALIASKLSRERKGEKSRA
ncbi:MAG: GerAB/ArcD/ProY family transporter [Oscillospiraceae bacterium]|nr:GerAB/ArcD/ProY family transporter [Oscillospiraceae bacterium]